MAGRKQHYIPQFILRGFASAGSGKKAQIRVVTRQKSFTVPTDGVAAEREFYSQLNDGPGGLDHVITQAENEYASLYRGLRAISAGQRADSHDVAELLTHLAVRGGHLRNSMAAGGQYALRKALDLFRDPNNFQTLLGLRV